MYMYNLASITLLDQSKLLQTEGLLVVKNYFAFISHTVFLFFPLLNIIFIDYWEFHTRHPDHPYLPALPLTNVASSLLFFCPCSHWSTVKLLVASPLKRSESFPSPTLSCAIHLWRATFQCPYHNF